MRWNLTRLFLINTNKWLLGRPLLAANFSSEEANRLSNRAERTKNYPHFERQQFSGLKDVYNARDNPSGICKLHLAEYKLSHDIMIKKLNEVTKGVIEPYMLYYVSDTRAQETLERTVASFFKKYFKAKPNIHPDDIICTEGVTASIEDLAYALADPGDCFLVPGPNFFRFSVDVGQRMEVDILPIVCDPQARPGENQGFKLTVDAMEKAYDEACRNGKRVKAVMYSNPVNPTGDVYSKDLLMDILHFAHRKQLHVISDEIYGLSVFAEGVEFTSVLSLDVPDPQKTHVLWGVSKDFGLSGMKLGVLHTQNEELKKLMSPMTYYSPVISVVQEMIRKILSDVDWLDNVFHPEHKKQLKKANDYCRSCLEDVGVYCHPSVASLFVWANFSKYMTEHTVEGEMELFQTFKDSKVTLFPGTPMMCSEPGWFRIVVTADKEMLQEGMERILEVLAFREKREN